MKKNAGRKQRRMLARSNRRAAGRERAKNNEKIQKLEDRKARHGKRTGDSLAEAQ
jgi:hypothetical protein